MLTSEADFTAMALMARAEWAPVLLSFAQRHDLMRRIFQTIDAVLGDTLQRILLHSRVPAGGRMPAILARETVFIVSELECEIARLLSAGLSFLSIHEGFVRHPLEVGNNEVEIAWHNPPEGGAARFNLLTSELNKLGFSAPAAGGGTTSIEATH
ncbi:hypothetical protein [Bradyrhizobium sp.]|uniref:hypothetical protein n=1 Tax=Bradyrhizobium sp. TaxID=376 RepID=UPI003C266B76